MAPAIAKSLSRLPRDSLVDLCLKWATSKDSTPYLVCNRNTLESDEEDYLYEPVEDTQALRSLYSDLKKRKKDHGGENDDRLSKRDIIDRIVDGDWRRGLSLQQLADIDLASLEQHDTALRWSALKLVPFKTREDERDMESELGHPAKKRRKISPDTDPLHYPTISPATFVANLKAHISPVVKAHYTLHKLSQPAGLVVLRLYIVPNVPFAPLSSNIPRNVRQATDLGRVLYIALPDSCPYVYVSLSGGTGSTKTSKSTGEIAKNNPKLDIAAVKRIVLESIPKALSRPQERWSLESTKLTCRSLKAIGLLRGNGRPGTAGGCYSKFSEEYEWKPRGTIAASNDSAKTVPSQVVETESRPSSILPLVPPLAVKNLQSPHECLVSTRFGAMASSSHAKIDRFHLTIDNILKPPPTLKPHPSQPKSKPKRKRRSLEDIEAGRDLQLDETTEETNTKAEPALINITFSGSDVFAGLRELALVDGGRYVDLDRLPSWMTGEKGVSGLAV